MFYPSGWSEYSGIGRVFGDGFKAGAKALVNIAIEGEMKRGKGNRKESFKWSYGHLFRKASIVNGVCQIDLETENDWNLLDNNFDVMPLVVEEGRKTINNIERSASLFIVKTIYLKLKLLYYYIFLLFYCQYELNIEKLLIKLSTV